MSKHCSLSWDWSFVRESLVRLLMAWLFAYYHHNCRASIFFCCFMLSLSLFLPYWPLILNSVSTLSILLSLPLSFSLSISLSHSVSYSPCLHTILNHFLSLTLYICFSFIRSVCRVHGLWCSSHSAVWWSLSLSCRQSKGRSYLMIPC